MTSLLEDVAPSSPTCAWCGDPIPPWLNANARCCKKSCRQKLARFRVAPAGSVAAKPLRFGYGDPPYPGFARKLYGCAEVDHVELVDRLVDQFPDGWALSTHADSLLEVGAIVRESILRHPVASVAIGGPFAHLRTGIWRRGSRPVPSRRARNAWEPVIIYGGRPLDLAPSDVLDDVLDFPARTGKVNQGIIGAKPPAFSEWLFRQLGAQRGDELVDVFPGSGAVSKAWRLFQRAPDEVDSRVHRPSRFEGSQKGDRRR